MTMKLSISERVKVSINPTVTPQHSRKIMNLQIWSSPDDNTDFAKSMAGIGSVIVFVPLETSMGVPELLSIVTFAIPQREFFCRVPINRRSCITRLNKRTRESEMVNLPGNVRLI